MNKLKILSSDSTFIIAELGLSHEGSLLNAFSMIDALSGIGVDAVKFQMHLPEFESSKHEKFRVNIFPQDKTRLDYWKRTSFSKKQWSQIIKRAKKAKILIGCTPFSIQALDLIEELDFNFIKIGSAEAVNFTELVERASLTSKPLIISSGMSDKSDLKNSAKLIKNRKAFSALIHCVSEYPTPLNKTNFNRVAAIEELGVESGVSDHTGQISSALYAIANGLKILEVHTVFDKRINGPDTSSSLSLDEMKTLIDFRDDIQIIKNKQVKTNKDHIDNMKSIFGRSFFAFTDIQKNELITEEKLILLKPNIGIPESEKHSLINKRANKRIIAGEIIRLGDLS